MAGDQSIRILVLGVLVAITLPAAILTWHPGWVTAACVTSGVLAWLVVRGQARRSPARKL